MKTVIDSKKIRISHALVALGLATLGLACSSAPAAPGETEGAAVLDAKAIAALPAGAPFVLEPGRTYSVRPSSGPIDVSRVVVRSPGGDEVSVSDWLETAITSHTGDFRLEPAANPNEESAIKPSVEYCVMCYQVCDESGCGTIYCEIWPCGTGGGGGGGKLQ